jgi:L-alanine-DL-glutamate epimerase-like enolase superfamily enzyme
VVKITGIEDLHCDAGWRVFSFLKITTDSGVVGWSEFNEGNGGSGLRNAIRALGAELLGSDPRPIERILALMHGITRQAPGGINQRAIAAIENALLDIKGKLLGVPVYELFGGPIRTRMPLYWSHCGGPRVKNAAVLGVEPIRSLDGIVKLGREVRDAGFKALKANIYLFDGPRPVVYQPGFAREDGWPELAATPRVLAAIADQLAAFREGAGKEVELLLDANFNFKTHGYRQVARVVEPFGLRWLEIDTYDAGALADIRRATSVPIASCESLYGRRAYRPFLEAYSTDIAIIDVPWNGFGESLKIAAMVEPYEVNVAPHNFHGHLATFMSAHFCAVVPHFEIMEMDVDRVSWMDEVVTVPPVIEDGMLVLPTGPGWGTDINEEVVRAHPPKRGG